MSLFLTESLLNTHTNEGRGEELQATPQHSLDLKGLKEAARTDTCPPLMVHEGDQVLHIRGHDCTTTLTSTLTLFYFIVIAGWFCLSESCTYQKFYFLGRSRDIFRVQERDPAGVSGWIIIRYIIIINNLKL